MLECEPLFFYNYYYFSFFISWQWDILKMLESHFKGIKGVACLFAEHLHKHSLMALTSILHWLLPLAESLSSLHAHFLNNIVTWTIHVQYIILNRELFLNSLWDCYLLRMQHASCLIRTVTRHIFHMEDLSTWQSWTHHVIRKIYNAWVLYKTIKDNFRV